MFGLSGASRLNTSRRDAGLHEMGGESASKRGGEYETLGGMDSYPERRLSLAVSRAGGLT